MIISKENFARIMAKNSGKTICSCEEYLDLVLDTFIQLLHKGHIIRFHGFFKAEVSTIKQRNTWNFKTKERGVLPERKNIRIRISKTFRDKFNASEKGEESDE